MNRLTLFLAASAISLTAASSAFADNQPAQNGAAAQGAMGFRPIARLCAMDQQWVAHRRGERLAQRLNLTDQQKPALTALQDAVAKSRDDAKAALCSSAPDLSSLPARMAFMQKRLQLRLDGMKGIQPKLEAFYAVLTPGQQAEFNEMWHHRRGMMHGRFMDGQGGQGMNGQGMQQGQGMQGQGMQGQGMGNRFGGGQDGMQGQGMQGQGMQGQGMGRFGGGRFGGQGGNRFQQQQGEDD